jgi:hypothetical protein
VRELQANYSLIRVISRQNWRHHKMCRLLAAYGSRRLLFMMSLYTSTLYGTVRYLFPVFQITMSQARTHEFNRQSPVNWGIVLFITELFLVTFTAKLSIST